MKGSFSIDGDSDLDLGREEWFPGAPEGETILRLLSPTVDRSRLPLGRSCLGRPRWESAGDGLRVRLRLIWRSGDE